MKFGMRTGAVAKLMSFFFKKNFAEVNSTETNNISCNFHWQKTRPHRTSREQ